jgi:MFS family permease
MSKTWTKNVTCISLSHLFLQLSTLILLPILPFIIHFQAKVTLLEAALVMGLFAVSLVIVGPFLSFLTEKFYRKRLAMFALLFFTLSTLGFIYVNNLTMAIVLRSLQGFFGGIAVSELTTLSIDVSAVGKREKVNLIMHNAHRIAIILAPIIIFTIYFVCPEIQNTALLHDMLYLSAGLSALSILLLFPVKVCFRAPINIKLLSLDRFLLCQSLSYVLIVVALAMIMGVVYALFPLFDHQLFQGLFIYIVSGLIVIGILIILRFVFLDVIRQCNHCQRSTANATFYLAWEIGIALGLIIGYFI